MRSRVIAGFCLSFLLLVIPGIALGYDWTLGDWGNLNLRGEMTYALKMRTEWPMARFVDPRSPYYVSGDANFSKWELGNNALIGTAELLLDSENVSFFGRMVGFVDFAYIDEDRFNTEQREHAAYNITDGLEFYVEGRTGGLTTRWGKQIQQWGESTAPIYAPGVNIPSPFFLQRVSSVGFNQRSWQVPTLMGWASYEVSEALSFEALWAPDFDPRYFMPVVGTYMSPADILGFGVESDLVQDRRPLDWVDQQQFGGAMHMVISELGMLELGFYYYHYLSRWPMLTFAEVWQPTMYIDWPQVDVFGMSFSQAVQAWDLNLQVGGEVTYRANEPLQLYVPSSPFIASVVGLPEVPAGYEKSNTIAWDINFFRFFFDVLEFTPYTFMLRPILEFYGKINLDYEDWIGYEDPQFTAYYNLICPLQTSDMIDNTRLDVGFSAMGGLYSQKNLLHTLGFTVGAKYGDNWEALVGYNLGVGTVKQDPMGQWMWDRDSFVLKLTYYFI